MKWLRWYWRRVVRRWQTRRFYNVTLYMFHQGFASDRGQQQRALRVVRRGLPTVIEGATSAGPNTNRCSRRNRED
jgi:hypothetical protein